MPAWPPALLGHCRRFAHAGHSRGGGRNSRRLTRSSVSSWRAGSSGGCSKSGASRHRWRRNCVSIWNAASSASGLCGRGVRAGFVVPFSCKGRGVCPSYNGRRIAQTAAHQSRSRDPAGVRPAVGDFGAQAKALLADGCDASSPTGPRPSPRSRGFVSTRVERLLIAAAARHVTTTRRELRAHGLASSPSSTASARPSIATSTYTRASPMGCFGKEADAPPVFLPARSITAADLAAS